MYPGGPGMMWGGYGYSPWWGFATMAFWALIVVAVTLIVIWVVRRPQGPPVLPGGEDRALSVLRERYARGEIGQDEYERMRQTLQ